MGEKKRMTELRGDRGAEELLHFVVNLEQTDESLPGFAPGQMVHMVFAQAAGHYYAMQVDDIARDADRQAGFAGSYAQAARQAFAAAAGTTPEDVTLLAGLIRPDGIHSPDIPQGAAYTTLVYDDE